MEAQTLYGSTDSIFSTADFMRFGPGKENAIRAITEAMLSPPGDERYRRQV